MAKRATIKPTTRTTVTRSRKGQTTRTTTTRSMYSPGARRAGSRAGNGKLIAGIIVVLLLLGVAAYILMNPAMTIAQQRSQFADRLSMMQNNNQNLTLFYLAQAPNYQMPVSKSWSVQVTDLNPTNSTPIGQFTASWNGQSRSFSILNGIVYTGISPTYALTLSHSEFMAFSQAVITRDTTAALAYYSAYYLTGKLNYTRIG